MTQQELPDPLDVLAECGEATARSPMSPDLCIDSYQAGTLSQVELVSKPSTGKGKTPAGNVQVWFEAQFKSEAGNSDDRGRSIRIRQFVTDVTSLAALNVKIHEANGGGYDATPQETSASGCMGRFKASLKDQVGIEHPALDSGVIPTKQDWADIIASIEGATAYVHPVSDGTYTNYNFVSREVFANNSGGAGGMEAPATL